MFRGSNAVDVQGDWSEVRVMKLVHALAATAGAERSRDAVHAGIEALGLPDDVLSKAQALALLDHLGQQEGIVGITAGFVKVRVEGGRSLPSTAPPPPESSPPPSSGRVSLVDIEPLPPPDAPMAPVFSRRMLVSLLTGTVGRSVAEREVNQTADRLGLPVGAMQREQALELLESLAEQPGVVGITARFAKARLLLRHTES